MGETIETAMLLTKMALKRLIGLFSQSEYDATVAYIMGYEDGMMGRACDPEKVVK